MKSSHSLLILTFFTLIYCSCDKDEFLNGKDSVIYQLTLEEDDPLFHFEGYAGSIADNPEGPSDHALLVSGGCIAPHLYRSLGPFENDMALTMCVEGQTLDFGGTVSLHNNTSFESIYLQVDDTDWTSYETEETLLLNQGETVNLSFLSGGIAASSTYFDNLVIMAVE